KSPHQTVCVCVCVCVWFSWGVGGSAYQTEGAWDQDGEGGPSIWDVFSHIKGKIQQNETGHSSCEGCYKFKDDVSLMKELKLNHYRFSISWPRITPAGIKSDHMNEKGIQHYDELIDTLMESKITPIVTLYHWDPPQVLQEKYFGWQNISVINHFNEFTNLCFEKFGNRIQNVSSLMQSVVVEGYETGEQAPGLRLKGAGAYRAAHHIIKAHAKVWHTYDAQWRGRQKGFMTSLCRGTGESQWTSATRRTSKQLRYFQFNLGWFATPIFHRDYPQVMKYFVGSKSVQQGLGTSRLPTFSSYFADRDVAELVDPRWPDPGPEWLYSVPWGFRRLLNFAKTQYGSPVNYVTGNGVSEKMSCTELCDEWRKPYFQEYINEMLKAIRDGVKVKGYTAWSLLDKFEWDEGYSERFGLHYVDYRSKNKPRHPKASVQFFKHIISSNGFPNQREASNPSVETGSSSNQLLAAAVFTQHVLPVVLRECCRTTHRDLCINLCFVISLI
uniref:Lactase like n=1 Tax=Nothobranchius furzeri TaxID=105023 RepID=A0A8C6P0J9_NOTFU